MKLNKQEILTLRDTFLFHHVSTGRYLQFTSDELPELQRISVFAGEELIIPQEPKRCIGIVTSGSLRSPRSDKMPDQIIKEGFVIGALELFSNTAVRLPKIIAERDSTVLVISSDQMEQIFKAYPELMLRYIKFMTGQVHTLQLENTLATTTAGDERLMKFLSMNVIRTKDGYVVSLPYSNAALADRLHMSRASLYRCFDRLEDSGVLKHQGKTILILKPELLETGDIQ